MALNAQGYFNCLRSYLNTAHYAVIQEKGDQLVLREKIFNAAVEIDQRVTLTVAGEIIAIKLDKKNQRGNSDPLFHFLDDQAKPWSKRCDFVIFQLLQQRIRVYCIEFKSETLPDSLVDQLNSSASWCKSLRDTIKNYTNKTKRYDLTKYVFSAHPNPAPYLDASGKYMARDHTVRHYLYSELNGMALENLENTNIEEIR